MGPEPLTPAAVLQRLEEFALSVHERAYAGTHARRYVRALDAVNWCLAHRPQARLLLDIAPHLLTDLFAREFALTVNSVGAPWPARGRPRGEHLDLDLNLLHSQEHWEGFYRHDIVMMGEILEHLHASPLMVLRAVQRWVAPGGYLIVQTPNAARLWARLTLLRGINPIELPRAGTNPGHLHEYTRQELINVSREAHYEIVSLRCENDFTPEDVPAWRLALRRLAAWPCPMLRESFTLILRKPEHIVDPVLRSHRLALHLDHSALHEGTLTLAGWCADLRSQQPVQALTLEHSGVVVPHTLAVMQRADVAARFGAAALAEAGFILTARLPAGAAPAELSLHASDLFGDRVTLGVQLQH